MSNLDAYLDSINYIPAEVKRNFLLIGELDERTKDTLEIIDIDTNDCFGRNSKSESEKRNEKKEQIKKLYDLCLELTDEKIGIAVQTYDLIDKHIRRLDTDIHNFEIELEQQEKLKASQPKKTKSESRKRKATNDGNRPHKRPKKSSKKSGSSNNSTNNSVVPIPEMKVDPSEPIYCICNRVSFGEMVGCDNPECRVEWFHFECVGLTSSPKGRWLCPECRSKKK
eukprot:TRINITY_DN8948_c0_g1_i1.p2 TRINITY_DN8948_c0_g1~~TRINITY_DN8948_c0_g1_i1.p2  ORF type:complete len:225 (-),score=63.53 TRINITY_DN8948_c0_g1_i1:1002-1676(-)